MKEVLDRALRGLALRGLAAWVGGRYSELERRWARVFPKGWEVIGGDWFALFSDRGNTEAER